MKNNNEISNQDKSAIKIQRTARSWLRSILHTKIFETKPNTSTTLENVPTKVQPIIRKLTQAHAIINQEIYHWTSEENLHSIIETSYFYGNQILKKFGINFEANALSSSDIKNGDGGVICMGNFVDVTALVEKSPGQEIRLKRKNLVRLTINLKYLDKTLGHYNQFFKLFDLMCNCFEYQTKINDELSAIFFKTTNQTLHCRLVLNFQQNQHSILLTVNDKTALFYGNLFSINLFCLTLLFELIAKNNNKKFKPIFEAYISTLNETDIIKILVVIGQGFTLLSEYNFNKALPLTPNLISEIHFVESGKSINLRELSSANYVKVLADITQGKQLSPSLVTQIQKPLVETRGNIFYQYGCGYGDSFKNPILRISADYRGKAITGNNYYETRPGLSNPSPLANNLISFLTKSISYYSTFKQDMMICLKYPPYSEDYSKILTNELYQDLWNKYQYLGEDYLQLTTAYQVLFDIVSSQEFFQKHKETFEVALDLFIKIGVNIDYPNEKGVTALHEAARNGNAVFAYILIKKGANHLITTDAYPNIGMKLTAANLAEHYMDNTDYKFKVFPQILRNPKSAKDADWSEAFDEEHNVRTRHLEVFKGCCMM